MSYTAVVLDKSSRIDLLRLINHQKIKDESWDIIAHHMTICMGPLEDSVKDILGKRVSLFVDAIGMSETNVAARVKKRFGGALSENKVPHITLAVNREKGGKPHLSNKIEKWFRFPEVIVLEGCIEEIR